MVPLARLATQQRTTPTCGSMKIGLQENQMKPAGEVKINYGPVLGVLFEALLLEITTSKYDKASQKVISKDILDSSGVNASHLTIH